MHFQARTARPRDKLIGLIYLWIAAAFVLAGVAMIVFVFLLCRDLMV